MITCQIILCNPLYKQIDQLWVVNKVKIFKLRSEDSFETGLILFVFENTQYCESEYKASQY
jgi:hypothetical protein